MQRHIVDWHHRVEGTLAVLNCGHIMRVAARSLGEEVDCPECHNDCAICGSPPVVQNTVHVRGQLVPIHLCRFCALGMCRQVDNANTLMLVAHISLVAHELLAEIRRQR